MVCRAFAVALALLSASAASDTIVTKFGAEFQGEIRDMDEDPIVLGLGGSNELSFYRSEIAEIRRDDKVYSPGKVRLIGSFRKRVQGSQDVSEEEQHMLLPLDAEQNRRYVRLLRSLDEENEEEEDSGLNRNRQSIIDALAALGPQVVRRLEDVFENGNPENAPYVLDALCRAAPIHGAEVAEKLAIDHKDSAVRLTAITFLAETVADEHGDVFFSALDDEQGQVRMAAVEGLGRTNKTFQTPALIKALGDPLPTVRAAAIEALQRCNDLDFETTGEWQRWYELKEDEKEVTPSS